MAQNYRFNFSTVNRRPGWNSTTLTPVLPKPTFDWSQTQTGVGYSRGVATPITGKVDPSRGGGGWITSFKNDDEIYLRMQNGGTAMGVPSALLKTYLKTHPNATLETIPKEILVGTTLRRASDIEDPNSRVNQLNREIQALHKNHPDDVITPLERAQLVRRYGQDALAEYDKVYPASATLADTAGSDPATVGHPKSYAGTVSGSPTLVTSPVTRTGAPVASGAAKDLQNSVDQLNQNQNQLLTDWQNRLLELGGGVGGPKVTVNYNPADIVRAGTARSLANQQIANQVQQAGNLWRETTGQDFLATLENNTPRFAPLGWGGNANALQAERQRQSQIQAQNRGTPSGATGGGIPMNSWQPGYASYWGSGGGWR